jgi:alkanesulfonate monooxygenase SsuD/methylene tetrahydromethanopterin reductase-like flavin-dependent oxidoreductase (luciferase family)
VGQLGGRRRDPRRRHRPLHRPQHLEEVEPLLAEVRAAEARVSRVGRPLLVLAEVLVVLDERDGGAAAALEELDGLAGATIRSDAPVLAGTPAELARTLVAWQRAGIDGVRLRPARLPTDLDAIVDGLVPELRSLGVRAVAPGRTLRERLGLGVAPNRYATAAS